jgi:5'-nucleotidase
VSGINKGWNLGDDVTYSGTVSGAFEAALLGAPVLPSRCRIPAESLIFPNRREAPASSHSLCSNAGSVTNVSEHQRAEGAHTKGFKVTVQARRNHITKVDERIDPRGQRYFWIEEGQNEWEPHDRSDFTGRT